LRSLIRELGFANALLYVAARLLERVSGGRVRLVVYALMAQPIGSPLLRDVSEAASTEVVAIAPDHPQVGAFPRPEQVIAERFANGATCHLALVKGDFAGFIWLQRDAYMEDEVRCRYVLDEPARGVWDFDVYVVPKYRLGRTLARLWRAVDVELERAGIAWRERFTGGGVAAVAAAAAAGLAVCPLARRVAPRGAVFDPVRGRANSKPAWDLYGTKKSEGHVVAWRAMMQAQLEGGGVPAAQATELAAWLWEEQPKQNLWRRPIPGMIELVRELRRGGVPVAVISNSEGRLAELVDELHWSSDFDVVIDSGRLGIAKPAPGIFAHACAALGVELAELLHVGDSWEADVKGAVDAGSSAVWFDARHRSRPLPPRVYGASNASELREVLARLGLVG